MIETALSIQGMTQWISCIVFNMYGILRVDRTVTS